MHKEIRNTLTYIVVATFVMITAVWQAQVSAKRDIEARHRALPPPLKTKRAIRPEPQPFSGDVVADYIARCEKGMTDQEIGWILEDFHNLGPSQTHPWDDTANDPPNTSPSPAELASFLAYTHAQTSWYREILRDGFRLSPEQFAELSLNLAKQLEKSQTSFIGFVKNGFPKSASAMGGEWTQRWSSWGSFYLDSQECHPWNLCSLTSAQEKMSWKTWYDTMEKNQLFLGDPALPDMRTPPAENSELNFLHSSAIVSSSNALEAPQSISGAEHIFPFLKNQKLSRLPNEDDPFVEIPADHQIPADHRRNNLIKNVRRLHPAQLKTLLLLDPRKAEELQQALDN